MNKIKLIKSVFLLSVFSFLTFVSCNAPVFYTVSLEELPLDPRIEGTSTNFVEFNGSMYVGERLRGTIHCYYKNSNNKWQWRRHSAGGNLTHLAATSNNLYALKSNKIDFFSASAASITLDGQIPAKPGVTIDAIYASNNKLFINARTGSEYSIYYYDENSEDFLLINTDESSLSMLVGTAYDGENYYFCFKDDVGIYTSKDLTSAQLIENSGGNYFTNIIDFENAQGNTVVIALSRTGRLFSVTEDNISQLTGAFSDDRLATSALGIWKKDINGSINDLLLVGRQDMTTSVTTGYTHGYLEIKIKNDDSEDIFTGSLNEPGSGTTTVSSHEHYIASIGKHGVHFIFQAPDGILFAGTNHGVWSYRAHRSDSKETWNAEE